MTGRPKGTETRSVTRRLPPEIFELPVEKMREGYYTDAYFNHTRQVLARDGRHPRVLMQVFQKKHSYLGGMDEAIAILKLCSTDWDGLTIQALHDGDRIQTGDGYAAYIAGQIVGAPVGVTTDEQASWWGGKGVGTVPHSLISSYGANTVLAATKFADWAPEDLNVTVLVDFENDSVQTAVEVARALGARLWGIRLDTSESLVDRSLWDELGDFRPTGVNERLVRKVREALDRDGFERVKIVASGGFDVEKIRDFERRGVPVDAYGIGPRALPGAPDFTAARALTPGRPPR